MPALTRQKVLDPRLDPLSPTAHYSRGPGSPGLRFFVFFVFFFAMNDSPPFLL
jgi:hypothetical protein